MGPAIGRPEQFSPCWMVPALEIPTRPTVQLEFPARVHVNTGAAGLAAVDPSGEDCTKVTNGKGYDHRVVQTRKGLVHSKGATHERK